MNVEICKIVRKSRTFFFPTINGKRLTKTNFARKYDAQKLINAAFAKYGEAKLEEIFAV